MSELTPPVKRLQLNLEIDAHTTDDLCRELRIIANDLEYEAARSGTDERHIVSGAGWTLDVNVVNADMTPERYDAELMAWWDAKRAARRGGGLGE